MPMQIQTTLAPLPARPCAVALGFFDGVHLGHRRVLGAAVAWGKQNGCVPAAFTFTLPAGSAQKGGRILSGAQKHERIAALGIEQYMEPPFESFRALAPERFVEDVLARCFGAKAVFCGDNFTFGARAAGNAALLQILCAERGIAVQIVPMAEYRGETVSSTRIRAALGEGNIAAANAMLGAPYAIDWPVVHGKGIGTGRLGTPTINQACPAGALLPGSGVYLTRICLDGRWWPAATGIGPRPTVDVPGAAPTYETYVPGFAGDVYGQTPTLEFHAWYAPTRKFDDIAALRALILQAGEAAKAHFAGET